MSFGITSEWMAVRLPKPALLKDAKGVEHHAVAADYNFVLFDTRMICVLTLVDPA